MNRAKLLQSRPFSPRCLLQTLFVVGLSLLSDSAWSLPVELVSHSAIDLIEAKQQPQTVSDINAPAGRSQEAEGRLRRERSVGGGQKAESTSMTTRDSQVSSPPETQTPQRFDLTTLPSDLNTPHSTPYTPHPIPPLDLDPKLIESSPVLQRWLQQVPDVLADIKHDPSFRTRFRLGYVQVPSSKQAGGLAVGIEDVFVGRSSFTFSADYQTAFNGSRAAWGGDLRYYIRPLGSVINVAPVVGYRHLETTRYSTYGVHVGLRLLLVPSRTGAADLAFTQSWVAPGSADEVSLTTLSVGYALTHNLRLSTDLQKQNSRFQSDSRVGIGLEWMF